MDYSLVYDNTKNSKKKEKEISRSTTIIGLHRPSVNVSLSYWVISLLNCDNGDDHRIGYGAF